MDQPDPDKVLMDEHIIEALRTGDPPLSDDQLYRLLAAWRDVRRGDTPDPTASELVEYAEYADVPERIKWEFIHDDGSFYERIAPDELPDGDAN